MVELSTELDEEESGGGTDTELDPAVDAEGLFAAVDGEGGGGAAEQDDGEGPDHGHVADKQLAGLHDLEVAQPAGLVAALGVVQPLPVD